MLLEKKLEILSLKPCKLLYILLKGSLLNKNTMAATVRRVLKEKPCDEELELEELASMFTFILPTGFSWRVCIESWSKVGIEIVIEKTTNVINMDILFFIL